MTPHSVLEQMEHSSAPDAASVCGLIRRAVVFYAGDLDDVPISSTGSPIVPPPFKDVLVHSTDKSGAQVLLACSLGFDGVWSLFALSQMPAAKMAGFYGAWFYDPEKNSIQTIDGCGTDMRLMTGCTNFLKDFFRVIACSNVRMVDVPAPEALNKKRAKAGKPLIKSHKVLHIVAPSTYSKAAPQGGTHASPRVHLRRGHIRKNPSGTTTWVQSCVVGSKTGMVSKDYRVSYAKAAA